jgi:hypothetical protein
MGKWFNYQNRLATIFYNIEVLFSATHAPLPYKLYSKCSRFSFGS